MQEGRKNLHSGQIFSLCRRTGITAICLHILFPEVRMDERRGKTADPLGSGGPQAPGDPLRPSGKPGAKYSALNDRFAGKGPRPIRVWLILRRYSSWVPLGNETAEYRRYPGKLRIGRAQWCNDFCQSVRLELSAATRRKKVAAGMRNAVQVGLTTQGSVDDCLTSRLELSAATRRKKTGPQKRSCFFIVQLQRFSR